MARYTVRTLTSDDFATLAELERDVFGAAGCERLDLLPRARAPGQEAA